MLVQPVARCLRGAFFPLALLICLSAATPARADALPVITDAEAQPLLVHVGRLRQALAYLGAPLPEAAETQLRTAAKISDGGEAVKLVQAALDPLCLLGVKINPESRVKVAAGPAPRELVEQGWRLFLVRVHNQAGVTAPLRVASPQARPVPGASAVSGRDRWLGLAMFEGRPMGKALSGAKLEYRILQVYSRDAGRRSAVISLDVGQGTQDIGFRNDVTLTFQAVESQPTTLRVLDENGKPTTAAFVIRDGQGRLYPAPAKRIEPDFAFHPQVYRADGETVTLPSGSYTAVCTRGPEYLKQERKFFAGSKREAVVFRLQRWIDPAKFGWWSGDHHIHAAGCAHYSNPSQGVHAPAMLRHCLGEDLKIGANLTWGPCFDYQKQFFTGRDDEVSRYPYLLRYDVEVSGFGSHRSGHLCLLRLKSQIPPGGKSKNHWPTLCLNTLRWAKKQGAVCGPAHSGWGLNVKTDQLPNYVVPPFNGIGANEYIVDVTHTVPGPDGQLVPAVDFISTVDTPYVWELNIWYHTLNCGYRTRVSGETDFPCIYGERVGLGRAYVKIDGRLTYDGWCEGIRQGRAYVGDGRSHLIDFTVGDVELGTKDSELRLEKPGTVPVRARVAAYLPVQADPALAARSYTQKPYWHVERARVPGTRKVKVELVVNGRAVGEKAIEADGELREVRFDVPIQASSWVAMRILATSHTNPVFVTVAGKPIRASRRSAQWCLAGVDRCWSQKKRFIGAAEMDDAEKAYAHARQAYRRILSETTVD